MRLNLKLIMGNNFYSKKKKPVDSKTCKIAIAKALKVGLLEHAVAIACYEQTRNRKSGVSIADIADIFFECGYAAPFVQIKEIVDRLVIDGTLTVKKFDE